MLSEKSYHIVIGKQEVIPLSDCEMGIHCSKWMRDEISYLIMKMRRKLRPRSYEMGTHIQMWMYTASNGAFEVIDMWSVGCLFRSGWFANMISSFAFVVIKGPSLIKIISARNQDIITVYEALIKVDIYGVGLATTRFPTLISGAKINNITPFGRLLATKAYLQKITDPKLSKL